jgi:hypothetical protein
LANNSIFINVSGPRDLGVNTNNININNINVNNVNITHDHDDNNGLRTTTTGLETRRLAHDHHDSTPVCLRKQKRSQTAPDASSGP